MTERDAPVPTSPESIIQIEDRYYVLASSSLADHRTQILKHGPTCVILDRYGDVHPLGRGQGLYYDGTRYLCRLELRIAGQHPILLSSTVKNDNAAAVADLTNPALRMDASAMPQDTVHLFRSSVVWDGTWRQRVRIRAYVPEPITLRLSLLFSADFADMFEVRGLRREKRGQDLPGEIGADVVTLAYEGLDGRTRRTVLRFDPAPVRVARDEAHFEVTLEHGREVVIDVAVTCVDEAAPVSAGDFEQVRATAAADLAERTPDAGRVDSSNEWFNDWVNRSAADLRMMLSTPPDGGLYPYAGVPWFDAPFGRDGIVTALETLWLAPSIAAGVLRYLAATQATAVDAASDAEPGKILHEARGGEMALCGEIPFHRYYGTVDATPLFVALAYAYWERTADRGLIDDIWPNLRRAVDWLARLGDRDGDGFVEYLRLTPEGLANQGWKDSQDSISHADGALADGPIALCEVQGYAYRAYRAAAALARLQGDDEMEHACRGRADRLRREFEARFWLPDLDTYALALDGEKRPCRVRASNAGHALLTGIASAERASRVARTLMSERSFSGWGIRTLAAGEARYNPMSYHNGSIWPHDNALIAAGMARYRLKEPVLAILTGLFDACAFMDLKRMPELFCGFTRRASEGPTLYPVACAPQSWAAGAVYLLLQACLGLSVEGRNQRVLFTAPVLPPFLEELRIHDLRVGTGTIDLLVRRHPGDVAVQVTRREGDVGVTIVK